MKNRAKNTNTMGGRIYKRRKEMGLTQYKLAKSISESSKRPKRENEDITEIRGDMVSDVRLRQWEDNTHAVPIKWMPAICDALCCDVGYLFGEYPELTRQMSDAAEYTGLSSAAVQLLHQLNTDQHGAFGVRMQGYTIETVSVIDDIIRSKRLFDITNNISLYAAADGALPQDAYNSGIDNLSTEEYEKFMSWANGRGLEVKSRKEVKEMYLQAAADALKVVCRDISEEAKKQNIKKRRKAAK